MNKIAIHLAGGGARGAYQVGILKGIFEILKTKTVPFSMITGVSVGSVNAAILAEYADDFSQAIDKLELIWRNIHCHNVFNTSNYQLGKSVLRNLSHIVVSQRKAGYLLDTQPLQQFIQKHIDFSRIQTNISENYLDTLEIISNCYEAAHTVSFYVHHEPDFIDWEYPRHISQRVVMTMEHILSSTSLPLFFPPIKIDGLHYGDGSMGLVSPLRGAIRFNVNKILILGTAPFPKVKHVKKNEHGNIGFGQVLGNMLSDLFLDNLDRDIDMVNRMNDIAQRLSIWKKLNSPWRPIDTLHLCPSVSSSPLAEAQYHTMPSMLRFLLNILGAKSQSGDLLSFLLFEKEFTSQLVDLGYQDTLNSAKAVEAFFS